MLRFHTPLIKPALWELWGATSRATRPNNPSPADTNNPRPTLTKLSPLAVDELFLDADFVAG
jgi:hypothetical protein